MDNLEEVNKSVETYSPPKLNQEEIDDLNRLITRREREYVKKQKTKNKKQKQKKPSLQTKV